MKFSRRQTVFEQPSSTDQNVEQLVANLLDEDRVKTWRALGRAMDVLVRAASAHDVMVPGLARRLRELWSAQPDPRLRVTPAEIYLGDKVVLAADSRSGRWIVGAFTAGLRGMTLCEDATSDDLARFAYEVANVESDMDSIRRFSDWMWSGGAQGLELALEDSFIDVLDVVIEPQRASIPPARRQEAAVVAWTEISRATGALTPEMRRQRFTAPMQSWEQQAEALLQVAPDPKLATDLSDDAYLRQAEWEALLEEPRLCLCISARRLAMRVTDIVRDNESVDARLVPFLVRVVGIDADYARGLMGALGAEAFGYALGGRVVLEGLEPDDLGALAEALPEPAGRGLLYNLIRRSAGEGPALSMLAELSIRWSLSGLSQRIEMEWITPPVASALAGACLAAGVAIDRVNDFLVKLPPAAAAMALSALPQLLHEMKPAVKNLVSRWPEESLPLIAAMLRSGPQEVGLLAEAFRMRRGEGWSEKMLERALPAMAAVDTGRQVLLEMVRSADADVLVRTRSIDALEATDLSALAEAVKWRIGELGDPPALRQRLQEARKRLKEAR